MFTMIFQRHHCRTSKKNYWLLVCCLCLTGVLGCGSGKYEERLGATVKMFNHMHELDEHLQGLFVDKATGIQIRPPRGFAIIPAPKPIEGPDGELEYPELDNRQPVFLDEELPGMIAAWDSQVSTDESSGEAYFYLLSNLGPMAESEGMNFRAAVLDVLDRQLGIELSTTSFQEVLYPPSKEDGFVNQIAYQEDSVVPEKLIHELPTEFSVYFHGTGEVQVCLIFVLPKNVEQRNEWLRKIELSLQTLKVAPRNEEGSSEGGSSSGGGF